MRRRNLPSWILGVLVGVWLASFGFVPITASDVNQLRLNQAAPLTSESKLWQTLQPQHNGLSTVELLAIVYPSAPLTATITLELYTATGDLVAEKTFTSPQHNQPLKLEFAPIADSLGHEFTLQISSSPNSNLSVWAYSLDSEPSGELRIEDQVIPGDLYFQTRYTFLLPEMMQEAGWMAVWFLQWGVVLWLTLFAPGVLILRILRFECSVQDHWARWGLALGISLSLGALAWQWATVMDWQWTKTSLTLLYGIPGIVTAFLTVFDWRKRRPKFTLSDVIVLGVLFVSGLVRWWAVRDLAFPQWVDSPHHLLIARLLSELGQMPLNYEPLLPVTEFTYHFGFHTLTATWYLLTQNAWPDIFLFGGQTLNASMSLATYSGVMLLTRRPSAAIIAAWLIGWISLFPAYYVSWGRYTQLAGWLILLPLLALVWRLVSVKSTTYRRGVLVGLIAVLASGLTLTHYRVLGFFATFVLVALALGRQQGWKWLSGATVLTCLLSLPWLWHLSQYAIQPVILEPNTLASPGTYNAFPWNYFDSGLERSWLAVTCVAAIWGLQRGLRLMWLLVGWMIFTTAVLNIGPGSWLVNNNSWAISLFAPGALILGLGFADWWATAEKWRRIFPQVRRRLAEAASHLLISTLAAFIGLMSVLGMRAQINIVNPVTTLYLPADREALDWVAQNISSDAYFVTNAWHWQYGIWANSDGGAWLWPWFDLRGTMPPLDYYYDKAWLPQVNATNEALAKITDARSPEALALLHQEGVTHVYIGARGGNLKPEMFVGAPEYKLLYTNGAAWVFEVIR